MLKIKLNEVNYDNDSNWKISIYLLHYSLKISWGNTAGYAGWVDFDDHSKGINQYRRGFNIEFDFNSEKNIVVGTIE